MEKKICNVCSIGIVAIVKTTSSFSEKQDRWPYIVQCPLCNASVGCHANTLRPLGPLAPSHIRALRAQAHFALDPIWESGLMTRDKAYRWLATKLGFIDETCHISDLDKIQLEEAIYVAKKYFAENKSSIERRRQKSKNKLIRQNETHRNHVIRRKKLR